MFGRLFTRYRHTGGHRQKAGRHRRAGYMAPAPNTKKYPRGKHRTLMGSLGYVENPVSRLMRKYL